MKTPTINPLLSMSVKKKAKCAERKGLSHQNSQNNTGNALQKKEGFAHLSKTWKPKRSKTPVRWKWQPTDAKWNVNWWKKPKRSVDGMCLGWKTEKLGADHESAIAPDSPSENGKSKAEKHTRTEDNGTAVKKPPAPHP